MIEKLPIYKKNGIDTSQVYISSQVHIVTSQHKDEDLKKYQQQQGSTGKGIAPCAKSKFGREESDWLITIVP